MVINLITYNLLFYEYKFLEKIVMSTNIFKFNDYKKRQERSILITTKALFNLKGNSNNLNKLINFNYMIY